MSFTQKIQPYAVIELDLTTARTDLAQGSITLRGSAVSPWKVNTITVLDMGGGDLSFKLNDSDNDSIPGSSGLKVEGSNFREIYWTNTVVGTTAKVFLAWVD
ncbi:MAG: hypothetical protein KKC55_17510 [Gammaproteobacteria bacterium]|uniref:Uncharacterized protein n=1 Tax=viral metagenome TaxID=1070528 RepID=A0A6M3LUN7_9ZZZZ|nr:hypothetical protein [Gammaproteobacteria bacterium]